MVYIYSASRDSGKTTVLNLIKDELIKGYSGSVFAQNRQNGNDGQYYIEFKDKASVRSEMIICTSGDTRSITASNILFYNNCCANSKSGNVIFLTAARTRGATINLLRKAFPQAVDVRYKNNLPIQVQSDNARCATLLLDYVFQNEGLIR